MNIDELLAAAARQLRQAGIEDADLDARLLFQHLTAMTRSQLVLHGGNPVDTHILAQYLHLVDQRSRRLPLQYLTGSQEFWSLDFLVTPAVLIPRPETEFLLEQVLLSCSGKTISRALDMCTGSGVIAVILARELGCPVVAVDISEAALAVAAQNIARHRLTEQITLLCSDLFAALNHECKYDLIVSNPPYVPDEQIAYLEPEVGRAEPRLALSGGPGGLRTIEQIALAATRFLQYGGELFLEIGADQKEKAAALFNAPGQPYRDVRVLDDWAGRPRVLRACYAPEM